MTLFLGVAGAVVSPFAAQAAELGAGYDIIDGGLSWLGNFANPDGSFSYCIDPGVSSPMGKTTTDAGIVSSVNGMTGPALAQLNYALGTWGDARGDNNQAAAMQLVVWSMVDPSFKGDGYYITRAPASERADILARATEYRAAAASYAPPAPLDVSVSLDVDASNNYVGAVELTTSPASVPVAISLTNGAFVGSNSPSATVIAGRYPVHGVPSSDDGSPYKIAGTWKADSSSAPGANVHLYVTPDSQTLASAAPATYTHMEGTFEDPMQRTVTFQPVATTHVSSLYVEPGDELVDTVRPAVAADTTGRVNPWFIVPSSGDFAPVTFEGAVYGPFDRKPVESEMVPAGAPLAGHANFTTSLADGPNREYEVASDTLVGHAGYYTWVWSARASSQTPAVQKLIPQDYSWLDRFGKQAETSIVPPSMMSTAVTGVTEGMEIYDTVTFDRFIFDGAQIRFDAYLQPDDAPSPVCNASTLVFTGGPKPVGGRLKVDSERFPAKAGTTAWVATLTDSSGTVLKRGVCGDPAEESEVEQLVVASHATATVLPGQDAVDTAVITGTIRPGDKLTFVAYQMQGSAPIDADAAVCDLTTSSVNLVAGVVDRLEVESAPCSFATAGVSVYWVETITSAAGKIIAQGARGADGEWTMVATPPGASVSPPHLALTGATPSRALWVAGAFLTLGVGLVGVQLVRARRAGRALPTE